MVIKEITYERKEAYISDRGYERLYIFMSVFNEDIVCRLLILLYVAPDGG